MFVAATKGAVWITIGGTLVFGALVAQQLTEADVHVLIDHLREGEVNQLQTHIANEASAVAAAEKQALLTSAERAAGAVVDSAARELKTQVDQAACNAKARVRAQLRGDTAKTGAGPTTEFAPANGPPHHRFSDAR